VTAAGNVTEALVRPLTADPGRPVITFYDDADGSRIELSLGTLAMWAAKTANWLRDELDVQPGDRITVTLPAHWQTAGVLLGAWWAGGHVLTEPGPASVALVAPPTAAPDGAADRLAAVLEDADEVAVVALDPLGRGATDPPPGTVDWASAVRVHADNFRPAPGDPADRALDEHTVAGALAAAADRARRFGLTRGARLLSTRDWTGSAGIIGGLLAVLSVGGSLVQVANPDPATLAHRRETERTTADLPTLT
jgi:uncharacterized protein (TIGR03089 family)